MAGSNDVQVRNEARQRMDNELEQLMSWCQSVGTWNQALLDNLGGPIANEYKAGYDFGNQLVTDLNQLCYDISNLRGQIIVLIGRTREYVEKQAEYNQV